MPPVNSGSTAPLGKQAPGLLVAALANTAHAVKTMTDEDAQPLYVLSRISPASHFAMIHIANECKIPPTREISTMISSDVQLPPVFQTATSAWLQRFIKREPMAFSAVKDLPPQAIPHISDDLCAHLEATPNV